MKKCKKLVLIVLLLNTLSFTTARFVWTASGRMGGDFRVCTDGTSQQGNEQTMTYLIAGTFAQPEAAFGFMKSEFGQNYTYINFDTCGWSAEKAYERIAKDIKEHGYQARIFTISLGDHVARYLEADDELRGRIEIYTINPCANPSVLQAPYDALLKYLAPPAEGVCYALGWLSIIPIIPCGDDDYSLMLLIDQFYGIYYDSLPTDTSQTYGVVCSSQDEFLRNDVIERLYPNAKIMTVETGHADTAGSPEKYLEAIKRLLEP